jgi:DNA-binding winged helix-turn-helix (wHTH) protein/Tol biopolymer transport system component
MPPASSSPPVVKFGVFEVNLRTGELRRHGIRIKLQRQPYQILVMLLEKPGEVISREEIRIRLWPEDTFVDFEHGVNTAVKKLRQVLGDVAEDPHYVETLPRVGYRFMVPVYEPAIANDSAVSQVTSDVPLAESETESSHSGRRSRRLRWALVLAALALAGFAAFAVFGPVPEPKVVSFVETPLSDRADSWQQLVTDGARVYFLERQGDHENVVQTSTVGGETRKVTAPFHNTRIFDISSDHSEFLIGDFGERQQGMPLWIWPVQGGSPIRVGGIGVDDAVWHPNGHQIVYVRGSEIRIVRRDGTDDRPFIHTSGIPGMLRWSPDASRLTFTVGDFQTYAQKLWQASAAGSNAQVRFTDWDEPNRECCGDWTPDGKYFLFASLYPDGISNLWAVRENRSWLHWRRPKPVRLTSTATPLWGPLSVRDGSRILAFGARSEFEHERYRPDFRQHLPFLPGIRALDLAISRDGNWVAIQGMPDRSLWRLKLDGTERVELVGSPVLVAHPRWSPDGTKIAFECQLPGGPPRACVVSAEGGAMQEVLPQKGEQSVPSWSADGKFIALAMNVLAPEGFSGPKGIYIVDWETRKATKLPESEGLTSPMWSPDGKYLTAKTLDEHRLLLFDAPAGKWKEIANGKLLSGHGAWTHDSKYLLIQDGFEPGQPIYRLHAGDFKRERILSFESILSSGVDRCVLTDLTAEDAPIITLLLRGTRVYALDLYLP